MSKFCKKCGKEIPQSSKKDICEYCQNEKNKFVSSALNVVVVVGVGVVLKLLKDNSVNSKPNV